MGERSGIRGGLARWGWGGHEIVVKLQESCEGTRVDEEEEEEGAAGERKTSEEETSKRGSEVCESVCVTEGYSLSRVVCPGSATERRCNLPASARQHLSFPQDYTVLLVRTQTHMHTHRGQSHPATLHARDNSAVWLSPVPTPPISHIKPRRGFGGSREGEKEREAWRERIREREGDWGGVASRGGHKACVPTLFLCHVYCCVFNLHAEGFGRRSSWAVCGFSWFGSEEEHTHPTPQTHKQTRTNHHTPSCQSQRNSTPAQRWSNPTQTLPKPAGLNPK